jgi:hypothetical protein
VPEVKEDVSVATAASHWATTTKSLFVPAPTVYEPLIAVMAPVPVATFVALNSEPTPTAAVAAFTWNKMNALRKRTKIKRRCALEIDMRPSFALAVTFPIIDPAFL